MKKVNNILETKNQEIMNPKKLVTKVTIVIALISIGFTWQHCGMSIKISQLSFQLL